MTMRAIVVGLGVQGTKRRKFAGAECVASVDPVNPEAGFRAARDVPLDRYDAALVCVPDEAKIELLSYFLRHGKHVLVEKPLWAERDDDIEKLQEIARDSGAICYTAYNHRFEPHFVRMRELIASGALGRVYSCRMFYGNGTARLVRESAWRDRGAGVLPDLGSHLIDTCHFWFGEAALGAYRVISANCFENRAPDHVVVGLQTATFRIELEMTLLMWRNHFTCDILAENGTAHIESLCKWGPTTFTRRTRVLPSGRPPEAAVTLVGEDPTWALEYAHFKELCRSGARPALDHDLWLQTTLRRLGEQAAA